MTSALDAADEQSMLYGPTKELWVVSKITGNKAEGMHNLDLEYRNDGPAMKSVEKQKVLTQDCLTQHSNSVNDVNNLSWLSITSFDESHSEMETLVASLKSKQQRKGMLYSTFASFAIIFVFGYIVVSFFTWSTMEGEFLTPADGAPDEKLIQVYQTPKFLMQPFNRLPP